MTSTRGRIRFLLAAGALMASGPGRGQEASEAAFGAASGYTVKVEASVVLPIRSGDEAGVFTGAGFVVDAQRGWIVTNAHVTSRSPATIRVRSRRGAWVAVRRIYIDPYLDIAIVVPRDRKGVTGSAAALDCGGAPAVGHPVGAFGHPWGLDFTGTRGIVAGVSDRFEAGALLTDAPINDGNSGGPLISLSTGNVVGVNTSALANPGTQNLNFAISARYLCRILDLLRAERDPSPLARSLVFSADTEQTGVVKVARNFMPPGFLALRPGDVIKEVVGEGARIESESQLIHALRGHLGGVSVRIERGNRELVLTGRLPGTERLLGRKVLYASGVIFGEAHSYDPSEINYSRIATCHVDEGSLGKSAGFEQCDAIESVDGEPVDTLADLHRRLELARQAHRAVGIAVKRIAGLKGKSFFEYRELSLPVEALRWVAVEDEGD